MRIIMTGLFLFLFFVVLVYSDLERNVSIRLFVPDFENKLI